MNYVGCEKETKYLRGLCYVYDASHYRTDTRPSTDLVALDQLFDEMYSISDRFGWRENAARESRLRLRSNDQYFYFWHCTELSPELASK